MLTRRGLIGTLLAAPVIIRPGVLMPVKPVAAGTIGGVQSGVWQFHDAPRFVRLPDLGFGRLLTLQNTGDTPVAVIGHGWLQLGERRQFPS